MTSMEETPIELPEHQHTPFFGSVMCGFPAAQHWAWAAGSLERRLEGVNKCPS